MRSERISSSAGSPPNRSIAAYDHIRVARLSGYIGGGAIQYPCYRVGPGVRKPVRRVKPARLGQHAKWGCSARSLPREREPGISAHRRWSRNCSETSEHLHDGAVCRCCMVLLLTAMLAGCSDHRPAASAAGGMTLL